MIWYKLIVIVLIVILLNLKIKLQVLYKKENENDYLEFDISLLKYLKIKREIPLIDIEKKEEKMGFSLFSKNNKNDNSPRKFLDFETIIRNLRFILDYVREKNEWFKSIIKYAKKVIVIKEFNFHLECGFANPVYTSVAFGILNSIVWGIFSYISYQMSVANHKINICPSFKEICFKTKFNCIFMISIGNIIYIGIQILLIIALSLFHNFKYLGKIINMYKLFKLKSNTR